MTSSGHFVQMSGDYDAENIRFTTNGDVVYAIQMGWPGPQKEVTLKSFAANRIGDLKIKDVSLVDSPESIAWKLMEQGLVVTTPLRTSNKMAICYRIKTEGLEQLRRSHATRPADK
jgi:alpha-L-fucosidase